MTAGCTDPSLVQKINRSGIQRLMRNLHQFQDSFRYYSYSCPWKLSHSLKWIPYGYFFQARIRPLIVYLQNVVQFNKAREIQNRAISAFSPLPQEKDKCCKPENRKSNSLLFQFTLLQKNYNRDKVGPAFSMVLYKSYRASSCQVDFFNIPHTQYLFL